MLTILSETYPVRGAFTISRGTKTKVHVVTCHIHWAGKIGRGECVPYARYGETIEAVAQEIASMRPLLETTDRPLKEIHELVLEKMKVGSARNALDCALWDVQSKISTIPVANHLGLEPKPLTTAYTLSLDAPQAMYVQAKEKAHYPVLKIKVGSEEKGMDIARMVAVRKGAPDSRLIVDANEGWNEDNLADNLAAAADCGVALVEQPLPVSRDRLLSHIKRQVAICADESLHERADLPRLQGLYDAVNIKLDKTGGLTEALALKARARAMGFHIMVGSMLATSLSMAPAFLLAQDADFVDLDSPLLLAQDREEGFVHKGATLFVPSSRLWG